MRIGSLQRALNWMRGMVPDGAQKVYRIYEDGILVPCDSNSERLSKPVILGQISKMLTLHTTSRFELQEIQSWKLHITSLAITGILTTWLMSLICFNSHRDNARLATITQLLTNSLSTEALNDLYVDLMNNRVYTVQDYRRPTWRDNYSKS